MTIKSKEAELLGEMNLTKWLSFSTCSLILAFLICSSGALRINASDFHFASGQQGEQKPSEYDGEIQSYEADNLLTIRKLPRVEVKYDLKKKNTVYSIAPGLQKFSKVHVTERDQDGTHYVTVIAKESKQP